MMSNNLPKDPLLKDDPLIDYTVGIIDALNGDKVTLTLFDIGRINRVLNFHAQDCSPEIEAALRSTGGVAATKSLAAIDKAFRTLKQVFNREMRNPYTRDRLIRAYCGEEASPGLLTETDKQIDSLATLQDFQPFASALEIAMNDKNSNSSLPVYSEGGQFQGRQHQLAEKILTIIDEGTKKTKSVDKNPQNKRIPHSIKCSVVSTLLQLVNIDISPKALQNKFSASR